MNKEEIEKAKQCLNETIQNTYAERKAIKLDNLRKYIQHLEQKESILDKVTEFIKDDIKINMKNEETNTDGIKEYWRGCIDTEAEILEFIEGEKEYCCNCGVELNSKNKAFNNMCNECKYGLDY